jgi:hypothetical protein
MESKHPAPGIPVEDVWDRLPGRVPIRKGIDRVAHWERNSKFTLDMTTLCLLWFMCNYNITKRAWSALVLILKAPWFSVTNIHAYRYYTTRFECLPLFTTYYRKAEATFKDKNSKLKHEFILYLNFDYF